MKRPKLVNADEYDTVCARRWYCYLQKTGVTSAIKRRIRRRERRLGKAEVHAVD
jgi:hypothetical protein